MAEARPRAVAPVMPVPVGDRSTRRRTLWLAAAGSLAFVLLCLPVWRFVLDDAYITYRFARNLADGQGIVWNPGEGPVEGYTNFGWMLIHAAGMLAQIPPVLLSKLLSVLAGAGCIWVLAAAGARLPWLLCAAFTSAVALNPHLAFHAMQGLETVVAALLLLLSARAALRLARASADGNALPEDVAWRAARGFWGWSLAASLVRVDGVLFSAGVLLGLVLLLVLRRDGPGLRRLLLAGLPFAAVGLAYWAGRAIYFGQLFPNTWYLKVTAGEGEVGIRSFAYQRWFLVKVLWPWLLLPAVLAPLRLTSGRRLLGALPVLAGCAAFSLYLSTVLPIQAHEWRYCYPVFPALILALMETCTSRHTTPALMESHVFSPTGRAPRVAGAALLVALAAFSLRLLPDVLASAEKRTQADRVAMGRALAGLSGTLFTTEAGALPYYSGWRAADQLGLTTEAIAHEGLSVELLQQLSPDLVMARVKPRRYVARPDDPLRAYLVLAGFVPVAAVEKRPGHHHFYFARSDSPLFETLTERLRSVGGLRYVDMTGLVVVPGLRVPARFARAPVTGP